MYRFTITRQIKKALVAHTMHQKHCVPLALPLSHLHCTSPGRTPFPTTQLKICKNSIWSLCLSHTHDNPQCIVKHGTTHWSRNGNMTHATTHNAHTRHVHNTHAQWRSGDTSVDMGVHMDAFGVPTHDQHNIHVNHWVHPSHSIQKHCPTCIAPLSVHSHSLPLALHSTPICSATQQNICEHKRWNMGHWSVGNVGWGFLHHAACELIWWWDDKRMV